MLSTIFLYSTQYARQTKGPEHATIITLCISNLSNYMVAGNLYTNPYRNKHTYILDAFM